MIATDKVPNFPGYTLFSKPRAQVTGHEKNRGGGLLMGIRNTIPCHEIKTNNLRDAGDGITEWQTIEIPLNKKEKLRVTNMYIPSERTGDTRNSGMDTVVTTRHWPSSIHDLIVGDLNPHSLEWDATLQTEGNHRGIERRRGDTIERWLADKDMVCLNTGKSKHKPKSRQGVHT